MITKRILAAILQNAVMAIILVSGTSGVTLACTGLRLIAKDGSVIHARTLEFAFDLQSEVIMVPRGFSRTGSTPDGKSGLKWISKYASIGANGEGLPFIFDGFNEKGLAVGLFYFPGSAQYRPYQFSDATKSLAPWELGSWIIENFASVEEVRKNIDLVLVPEVVFKAWGYVPPVHYVIHDASGKSLVIEYVNKKLNVHDNPLGIMSNSPSFDWHMTNLRNYVNVSFDNVPPVKLGGVELKGFGQGTGLLGLPGDFTPPSRFVRIAHFSQGTIPAKTGFHSILQAFHILNNFDIPKGVAREKGNDNSGNLLSDYTTWTSASDLQAKRFYFRTFNNSQIRMIELMKMNLDAKNVIKIPMKGEEVIKSITP